MSIGMDAFRLAAEMRYSQYTAVKTTKDINVCKIKDVPTQNDNGLIPRHMETGICVMLHNTENNTVLEVRGYDENLEEFSYKFHYEKSPKQPVNMRAVGASGDVNKLKISLEKNPKDKYMTIHNMKEAK